MSELLRHLPRLLLGLLAFAGAVAGLGAWLREPITLIATLLVERLGALGLIVGFAATDLVPLLPHSVVLLLGHVGGMSPGVIVAATSLGAMVGASTAWAIGRLFGRVPWIVAKLERYGVAAFLQKYGAASVAVASLTPMPDSLTIIGAGASGVPLRHVWLGASVRIPKIIVYLWAIEAGWSVGA